MKSREDILFSVHDYEVWGMSLLVLHYEKHLWGKKLHGKNCRGKERGKEWREKREGLKNRIERFARL